MTSTAILSNCKGSLEHGTCTMYAGSALDSRMRCARVVRVQTKEHTFQSRACAEFAKLRTVQAELEQEAGQACFLGCSVTQTGLQPAIFMGKPMHIPFGLLLIY